MYWSLPCLLWRTWMMAMLSYNALTVSRPSVSPQHSCNHNWPRISSFIVMWTVVMELSHCSWNHSPELNAPQPELPHGFSAFKRARIDMPFHAAASWNHHSKPDQNSLLRHMQVSICLWDEDRIILWTNDHPGLVTVAARCSRPMRDKKSSCFVQHLRPHQEAVFFLHSAELISLGTHAVAFLLCLLHTVRVVARPSDLVWFCRNPKLMEGL